MKKIMLLIALAISNMGLQASSPKSSVGALDIPFFIIEAIASPAITLGMDSLLITSDPSSVADAGFKAVAGISALLVSSSNPETSKNAVVTAAAIVAGHWFYRQINPVLPLGQQNNRQV
ncbi:MAG TPA: hypothetical protein VLG50_01315 [Candidatus Saccharimonadales bacterium]|nr:hypothetical protein [Candidatus Saccharimonadales bacterium]